MQLACATGRVGPYYQFQGHRRWVGPMRSVLLGHFPTLLRCDPPESPLLLRIIAIYQRGSNANHSQNTPDEWRPRRCGLFAQRGRTPRVQRPAKVLPLSWMECGMPRRYSSSLTATKAGRASWRKPTPRPRVCRCVRGHPRTRGHSRQHRHSLCPPRLPLVLLVGQVERAARGREAGQEIDYTHFFGSLAKWVIEVSDPRACRPC